MIRSCLICMSESQKNKTFFSFYNNLIPKIKIESENIEDYNMYHEIFLQDMSILRDYIAYSKEHVHPKLSDEASQKLIQAYVDMRKIGSGRGQISAYPRQLESLIRLSEAHAKVRFSQTVEIDDVEEAYR